MIERAHNDGSGHLIDKQPLGLPPASDGLWMGGYDNPVLDDFDLRQHAPLGNGTYNTFSTPHNS